MALGDNTLQAARGNSQRGRNPYYVQTVLNLATALSDKGTALAAADAIPVIAVPKGHMVLNAGIEVDTQSDGSTFTVDLGMVDADVFVDGFDGTSAAAVVAQNPAAYQPVMAVANDNIDLTIATLSGGAVTTGKFRIWAVLMDCTDAGNDGTANEVDRDLLA
jgi:hypothetical protein|tara:strand:+ start:351 stop:836 length:486 start_codon:yes stop_codon:yes gene_type:complete